MNCSITLVKSYYAPRYTIVLDGYYIIKVPKKMWFRLLAHSQDYKKMQVTKLEDLLMTAGKKAPYRKAIRAEYIVPDLKPFSFDDPLTYISEDEKTIQAKIPNRKIFYI